MTAPNSIAARIERLPLGRFHRRFITLVSLGNFFDLYDIFVVAYIGAALQQSHFITLQQFTAFIASGFFGMFVGTIAFGIGSDRFGRRIVFMTLLLLYSVFTLACAFAPSANWLIVLRFFAGAGIGAEIIIIDAYVSEIVPSRARGRYVAITQVVGFCAVPVAALLARVLVPTHFLMAGWRWVVLIGSAGALLTWWFRRHLPESPRWLASRGRTAEAESVLAALESESFANLDEKHLAQSLASQQKAHAASATGLGAGDDAGGAAQPNSAPLDPAIEKISFAELFRSPYLGRTVMMIAFQALQTIGFYGFANWAPTFLLKRGFSLLHSLEYTMLIAVVSPIGPLSPPPLPIAWSANGLSSRSQFSSPHLVWDSAAPARRSLSLRSERFSRSPTIGSPPRSTPIRPSFFPRAFAPPPSASPTVGAASAPHFLPC